VSGIAGGRQDVRKRKDRTLQRSTAEHREAASGRWLTFQQLPSELQHGAHLRRGFPFIRFEHAETHSAGFGRCVIANVRVVDFRCEGDCRRFEGVVFRESECKVECAALREISFKV
jgi:hypothetical protein